MNSQLILSPFLSFLGCTTYSLLPLLPDLPTSELGLQGDTDSFGEHSNPLPPHSRQGEEQQVKCLQGLTRGVSHNGSVPNSMSGDVLFDKWQVLTTELLRVRGW